MSKSFNPTERIGIHRVALIFLEEFRWIEREQLVSDMGIDMQVEIVENSKPTGSLFAIQVKTGESYFKEKNEKAIVYRGEKKHLDYWLDHSLPVLVILHDPTIRKTYWQKVDYDNIELTEKNWKLEIPIEQELTVNQIEKIMKPYNISKTYTFIEQTDFSHYLRRVSAKVLIESKLAKSKKFMREVIPIVNKNMIFYDEYKSEIIEKKYKNKGSDIVTLFFYDSIESSKYGLPFCRTIWFDENCKERDLSLKPYDEEIDGIEVKWENSFAEYNESIKSNQMTKGEYLKNLKKLLPIFENLKNKIKKQLLEYDTNKDFDNFIGFINEEKENINELYKTHSDNKIPPNELNELDELLEICISCIHDMPIIVNYKERKIDSNMFLIKQKFKEVEDKFIIFNHLKEKWFSV